MDSDHQEHEHGHGHGHEHGHGHAPRSITRHCDVAVVGGSAAGLAAALQLGRQRRSVAVIDSGTPRNAPAAHMHGYLGHEGVPPAELLAVAREEVRSYGGEVVPGRVIDVRREADGRFVLELTGGHRVVARRVLAATGLVDVLPEIPGVAEQWGRGVIHCPFCHGYEVRDRRVVLVVTSPVGLHQATLFRQLTDDLTLVLHDGVTADDPEVRTLQAAGVGVVAGTVARVVGRAGEPVEAVELDDGRRLPADVVVVGPRFRARIEPFGGTGLGATAHPSGLGDVVEVDAMGATAVAGLYAAGNVTDPGQQVLHAAAHGSRVGAMIASDLAHDDAVAGGRPSALEADWDQRYSGAQMWSGNPNGALVVEVEDLAPGTALDVGAGEGGDAVWLAERGWQVTANDISQRALDRVAAEATRRGLDVACVQGDVNGRDPFGGRTFDLVTAHYASIPRSPDDRAVHHLLRAVRPGGTLLVVTHDLEPMRGPVDVDTHSRPFDPDAYVRTDDVARVLATTDGWVVETHVTRPRPAGASSHHVDDVVLRARRA